jgi:tetratricopeptide (TPR) repeat protein
MDAGRAAELVRLAEHASRSLDGVDARLWRERIEANHANLEDAFAWLCGSGHSEEAARLALALEKYWMAAGRLGEGRRWFDQVLDTGGALSDHTRALVLHSLGMLAFWLGDDTAARAAYEESRATSKRAGMPNEEALAQAGLARLALRAGALDEARSLCESALRIADDAEYSRGRSSALHVLSVASQMRGDLEEARDHMYQRMELERQAGALRLVAAESSNLSAVERQLGHLARARELALEALEIEEQQEDVWSMPYTFNQLAAIAVAAGDLRRAATLLAVASRMVEEQAAEWPPDEAPVFAESRASARSGLGDDAFDACCKRGSGMSWRNAAAYARLSEV